MRILFVKTSSLGDVIHNCPAVSDTRRRFPEAVIDWVVEESFAGIVHLHPAVRRAIPVAIRRWRSQVLRPSVCKQIVDFNQALRAEPYDVIIDTQGLLKSALITWRARGVKHGYNADCAREPIAGRFYDVTHFVPRDMHAVERNRTLTAAAFGAAPAGPCEYGLVSGQGHPAPVSGPYCVLLCMTSRADKLWPESHWAELVKALAGIGRESVLPWGSEAERARCGRIVESAGSGVVPNAMPLGALAGLMKHSVAVIGVDTGLAHLAVALDVPAVGLYVCTDPALTGLHGRGRHANIGGRGQSPSVRDAFNAVKTLI